MVSLYSTIRSSMEDESETIQARVEVNQRALIDKILARYASANAVYRELLQNSNDANASKAEIYFDVTDESIVTQVLYRNNGMPFRPQDWTRLQKIAEGNPDPAKVGAFGVGAYSMFSICEEPMVISGSQALAFVWRGDALWSKVVNYPSSDEWTSFCLPSRDPYPQPDFVEFGQFLCANLTFTQSLKELHIFVNKSRILSITKTMIQEPIVVQAPKKSSWWRNDGAETSTNLFSLQSGAILESRQQIRVELVGNSSSSITARYVSGVAKTKIPPDIAKRMERVTKKLPPQSITVQAVLADEANEIPSNDAERITASFSPELGGRGRIFIGFRTSQTTGLAAHVQAPLIPTVEREAVDLQDTTLRIYNTELLQICGIILRLALEHAMVSIGQAYLSTTEEREILEKKHLEEERRKTLQESKSPRKEEVRKEETAASSLLSFAMYMAKGVTKQIVNAISAVDSIYDDGRDSLLNPRDSFPLTKEERQAIALMRAFCPQQSTPDSQVGTAIAQGFSMCLKSLTPPLLTKGGVSREGRLPYSGIESFVAKSLVVRKSVYQNAKEYHDVLCQCQRLTVDDLISSLKDEVLDRDRAIRLVQWWVKFSNHEPSCFRHSLPLRDAIRFKVGYEKEAKIDSFNEYRYFVSKDEIKNLPLPESVLPRELHDKIGKDLPKGWFVELPIDLWAEFIAQCPCMSCGRVEDERVRVKVLSVLCKEWKRLSDPQRTTFGVKINNLLCDLPCLPFDSDEPTQFAAKMPSDLYLRSAELKAFANLFNNFQKVSQSVYDADVTEDFLLLLGVRKSVAVDFLFAHLDSLKWSDDPKPLVEYLRTATLTRDDILKLKMTKYLPAENDVDGTFAPQELHLPSSELRLFPSVRLLQWPSDELTPNCANGKFLIKLGMKTNPNLMSILKYISDEVVDSQIRFRCLSYVSKHLAPNGVYQNEYRLINASMLSSLKIMPCVVHNVFSPSDPQSVLQSPSDCFTDTACLCMGFSVVDAEIDFAGRFKVPHQPDGEKVVKQFLKLVSSAKTILDSDSSAEQQYNVLQAFSRIFNYMSQRSNDLNSSVSILKNHKFIPCSANQNIKWADPESVYFENTSENVDTLTKDLFSVVEFHPFLASVGVKFEATTSDLFRLILSDPSKVLKTLGSDEKYRILLRRIAANPPFHRVTPHIKNSPFLLAYQTSQDDDSNDEKRTYMLAKADEIYIIDNSFFGRMFPVLKAPHETDLETFYAKLGSFYISKGVLKTFEIIGKASSTSPLTDRLSKRIEERRPLLVSTTITSRPLVPNVDKVIDSANLKIFEVESLKAIYSLNNITRTQRITSCAKELTSRIHALYVTSDFDWFDVGYAIGGLILQRCQLEDAFFIGSILEAPLEQLRSRGFPVDRILISATPVTNTESQTKGNIVPQDLPPQGQSKEDNEKSLKIENGTSQGSRVDGFCEILKQMFPDCDESFLRKFLNDDSTIDSVRQIAEDMAVNGYRRHEGKNETSTNANSFLPPDVGLPEKEKKLGRRIGQALGNIRNNVGSLVPTTGIKGGSATPLPVKKLPPAEDDAFSHSNLEEMLKTAVAQSTKVNPKGITSAESAISSIPDWLTRPDDGCEIIPGQALKVFLGPYRSGKTHNGVRVFSSRNHSTSDVFLSENFHAVDVFADVIQNLCGVYQLNLSSVAIFHDPSGGTIAFNANRALHFNVRFFHSLHYRKNDKSRECYSYWFTTFAHELAHHLVTSHNKEHGFYTESYISMFLPRLLALLTQLEEGASPVDTSNMTAKFS